MKMNWPNRLSLIRIASVPVITLLLVLNKPWAMYVALFGFIFAAITDFVDGHIARKYNLVTNFGKFIDPVADKLLNLSAMIMLTLSGQLPHFAVIIILARELAVDGLRMVAVGQGRVIAAGNLGKIKTVSQMFLIIFLMLVGRLTPMLPDAFRVIDLPVQIIGWAGTAWVVIITVWSGVDYFAKNFDCIRNAK